jgi:hypothetical protein
LLLFGLRTDRGESAYGVISISESKSQLTADGLIDEDRFQAILARLAQLREMTE